MNTAQKVRLEKQRHPERFCKHCLWRVLRRDGTVSPCKMHPPKKGDLT